MKLNRRGTNETELVLDDGVRVLFSYNTPVAAFIPGPGPGLEYGYYVGTLTKFSPTTTRHINRWLAGRELYQRRPQAWFDGLVYAVAEVGDMRKEVR